MKLLLELAFRNLFRQKRRNLLLGSAISIGIAILITAGSFSRGIKDIMFNKIVTYVSGHIGVNVNEGSGRRMPVFRDRERLLSIVRKNTPVGSEINESLTLFVRAMGNGRSDNMVLAGIDTSKDYTPEQIEAYNESFSLVEGKFEDLGSPDYINAVILSKERAEMLNVKRNDTISIKFRNIFGQNQSERLTVIGILSNDNMFMQGVMFCELRNVKSMMGYRPHETVNIHIKIRKPERYAVKYANLIHAALKPGPAFIYGKAEGKSSETEATIIPFLGDNESLKIIGSSFKITHGRKEEILKSSGAIISSSLAKSLGVSPGESVTVSYSGKFDTQPVSFRVKISGIFSPDKSTGEKTIYIHEALFYPKFYDCIPDLQADSTLAFIPSEDASFKKALGSEWELLPRTSTSDELKKKKSAQAGKRGRYTTMDVNSMYESASDVLKLESVLNLITLSAVLVLFFIILIGVVNTLRMTIRERTREIGTLRAIGMQISDVRKIFILETSLLSLLASLAGTLLSLLIMGILSHISFGITDNPMGMLLVNRHLYFMPAAGGIIFNIIFILIIIAVTAYFPASRAANMPASEALRHYE